MRVFIVSFIMISAFIFIGTFNHAFANTNIQTLLTSWFEGKKDDSITSLEEAISKEKDIQMERLKAEIARQLSAANKELEEYTAVEAEKRKLELRQYTEELINSFELDQEEQQHIYLQEVEQIMMETYEKLEEVKRKTLHKTE